MAKKIQIDIEVNGKMQKATVSAKKLEQALSGADRAAVGLSGSAHTADRRLKGAAQASANGTKNFSKMAQGISGGLVPAYATLAAQVFAVSAVFQFLRSASDTANLIAGQQALAATTGVAYKSITNSIKEATDGQLSFAESARAAAIGTASGLSPTQLNGLASAAKNASIVLGRDLTDSFNRLVRGVTKAEPELLDELGIILRLETATEKYKNQLGIVGRELTAFERTQAVANEVLGQAEQKYAAIEQIMDPSAASLNRFLVSFEELINTIKTGVIGALRPVFDFLSENTLALTASLGLFALPILKSILPAFDEWEAKSRDKISRINRTLTVYEKKIDKAKRKTQEFAASSAERKSAAISTAEGILGKDTPESKSGRSGADFLLGRSDSKAAQANAKKILANAEAQIKQHGVVVTGYLKGKNAEQVADLRRSYTTRVGIIKGTEVRHKTMYASMTSHVKLYALQGRAAFASLAAGAQVALGKIAAAAVALQAAMGWIGLIALAGTLLYELYRYLNPIPEEIQKANDAADGLSDKFKDINDEAARTVDILGRGDLLGVTDALVARANALNSADLVNSVLVFEELDKNLTDPEKYSAAKTELSSLFNTVGNLDPTVRRLGDAFEKQGYLTKAQKLELSKAVEGYVEAAAAVKELAGALETLDQAMLAVGALARVSPFQDLATAASAAATASNAAIRKQREELEQRLNADAGLEGLSAGRSVRDIAVSTEAFGYDTLPKEVQAVVDIYNNLNKEMEEITSQNEYLNRLAKEYNQITEQLNTLDTHRLHLLRQVSEEQTAGITFADKLKNLELEKVSAAARMLPLVQKVITAQATLAATQEGTDRRAAAEQALALAEEELVIAVNSEAIEQKKRDLQAQQLNLQKQINAIQRDMKPLQLEQELLAMVEKRAGFAKTILDAEEKTGMNAIRQKYRDEERADPFGFDFDREKRRRTEELEFQKQLAEKRKEMIDKEKLIKDEQIRIEYDLLRLRINAAELELQAARAGLGQEVTEEERQLFSSQRGMVDQVEQGSLAANSASAEAAKSDIDEKIDAAERGVEALDEFNQVFEGLGDKLADGMTGAFMSIMDGTKSVKQAFGEMAKAIIADIMKMIIKLLIQKAIMAAMGMAEGGVATPDGPGMRYGGIVKPRGYRYGGYTEAPQMAAIGGVFKGPSAGYPVIMHGTEAVVPLPNGREIPVEMKGGGGQNNNVTVNISMDNSGAANRTQSSNGQEANQLGNAVAAAVQRELQNQKRAGGILSPYGAA